jgi:hypothetical protein
MVVLLSKKGILPVSEQSRRQENLLEVLGGRHLSDD